MVSFGACDTRGDERVERIVVVGGGAAGMIAAWRAAQLGARTVLLEKNARPGLKIHISGGGKCNITHAGPMEEVRSAFRVNEARFLRPSFARFTNSDVLHLLRERGVQVYTRPDGRIFPVSGNADDVVNGLMWHVEAAGVEVRLGAAVEGLIVEEGEARGVTMGGHPFGAARVILATGGSSYPKTGTTGEGYRWARESGHHLAPLRAALAPMYLREPPPAEWSGIALRDCVLRARPLHPTGDVGKVLAQWRGDTLFTHKGISGPTALGISREVDVALESGRVVLEVDLLPDRPHEEISAEITSGHRDSGRRIVRTLVSQWVPERLTVPLLSDAGVEPDTPLHQLPRPKRQALVNTVKAWRIGEVRAVPLERGEVTAGGVELAEVDPGTMASRIVRGLYLAGEILDIAGPVGGYNLQAAFATGYVAGQAAAQSLHG